MSQQGTVLSEVLRHPGPTHSVFDVLAAAAVVAGGSGGTGEEGVAGDIALLGFGGGSVVAALRGLGSRACVHGVDSDATGRDLVRRWGGSWLRPWRWARGDAVGWLEKAGCFDVIIDDLSVAGEGEVEKPAATWDRLPSLMARHLRPGGRVLMNLLRPAGRSWAEGLARVTAPYAAAWVITLDAFENRIVVAGEGMGVGGARRWGDALREGLRRLGSRQADEVRVTRWTGATARAEAGVPVRAGRIQGCLASAGAGS